MPEVWIRRQRWRVVEERRGSGLTALRVAGRDPADVRTFLAPCDAVVADRRSPLRCVPAHQALARLAGHVARTYAAFTPASLCHASLDVLPFQLEPALAWCSGRRRLLIADAVGMGKTVQAGILLRSVIGRHPEARCLVVAPASLLPQWGDELRARLSLDARIADALSLARLRASTPYLSNPWLQPGIWLASPDFLKQPHVLEALPDQPWTMVVCDEAHQLSGESQRQQAVHQLTRAADTVVLLTATPHDGDDHRYRRLLALGSRGDRLTVFQRTRPTDDRRRRTRWLRLRLAQDDVRLLAAIDAFERTAGLSAALPLICGVFQRRALSSPGALARSLERRLMVLDGQDAPCDPWHQPGLFDADVLDDDEAEILTRASGIPAVHERSWIQRLQHLCRAGRPGSRTRGLTTLLRRSRDHAVVFTHYRDSLPAMLAALPSWRRAAVMHGGLTPAEQQQSVRAFLDRRVDTLVATDVASQGLNLQTAARWAISFDVPWTPLRLEQRIGRVDRIGQTRRVHATILTTGHARDLAARDRLNTRTHVAAQTHVASSRRWTRAANGLARWSEIQRTLAEHWRHEAAPAPCQASVAPAFVERWLGRAGDGVDCYDVPFVLSTGDVLERIVVAVPLGTPAATVAAHFANRALALTRRAQVRATQQTRAVMPTAATQPGLFTHNAYTIRLRSSGATADFAHTTHTTHTVVVGPPRLVVRFVRRP